MIDEQFTRIVSAIEFTLHQMRDLGPKPRGEEEFYMAYKTRVENWYKHKQLFLLFAVKCLRHWDKRLAAEYLAQLKKITEEV
jgi:hypothetical protein